MDEYRQKQREKWKREHEQQSQATTNAMADDQKSTQNSPLNHQQQQPVDQPSPQVNQQITSNQQSHSNNEQHQGNALEKSIEDALREIGEPIEPPPDTSNDEEMARRLHEELNGPSNDQYVFNEGQRDPLPHAARVERLIPPDSLEDITLDEDQEPMMQARRPLVSDENPMMTIQQPNFFSMGNPFQSIQAMQQSMQQSMLQSMQAMQSQQFPQLQSQQPSQDLQEEIRYTPNGVIISRRTPDGSFTYQSYSSSSSSQPPPQPPRNQQQQQQNPHYDF